MFHSALLQTLLKPGGGVKYFNQKHPIARQTMYDLSIDSSFSFELVRLLAHCSYGGADVGECLVAASEIVPGDFESWYAAWNRRAERLISLGKDMTDPIAIRDNYFRAATYCRAADFFIHGNWSDPRIKSLWATQTECFDKAMALLDVPGFRKLIPADGFKTSAIVFPASKDESVKRPTILMTNGYDGSMEEIYHLHGRGALEHGYNLVCFDGPGQPSVRRDQDVGFIHEWEKAVSPLIDYLETLPYVDATKIGELGYSMSGLLAARAAAFDDRIAAVFSIDGLYDINDTALFEGETGHLTRYKHIKDFEGAKAVFNDTTLPTGTRWSLSHGLWAFKVQTPAEFLNRISKFSLVGIADRIKCPVFIGDAASDRFFQGQPQAMAKAIGDKAKVVEFTEEDGAALHCNVGASRLVNRYMYEWFEQEVVKK